MNKILILLLINALLNYVVHKKILSGNITFVNLIITSVLLVFIATKHVDIKIDDEQDNSINEQTAYVYPIILSITILFFYFIIKKMGKFKDAILSLIFFTSIATSLCQLINVDNTIVIGILLGWFIFDYATKNSHESLKVYINNVIAILVALSSIGIIKINKIKTGIILLIGLFFFDIFWVFGSKKVMNEGVMESVATNIDAPIMLKFFSNHNFRNVMILGLGDIVLPGIFIKSLSKTQYFNTSIISYIVGLVFTVASAVFFKTGQPALLYIVPSLIIPLLASVGLKGDWSMLNKSLN
jgi:hypothetical protein